MEDVDLGVCRGRWYDGAKDRIVVVLPGARYLPFGPLLWFSREVAQTRGWSVLEVWDEYLERSADPRLWVNERAEAALASAGNARVVLVTKSIASHAVGIAAERAIPGIWLTPLLNLPDVAAAFERLRAPALLVGGTADESWDAAAARRPGHEVLELDGADHTLQLSGDPIASIGLLQQVTERLDAFLGRL